MSTIHNASQQILEAIETRRRRESERRRLALPIRAVDAIIADLEELNLAGRSRVPESFDARLRGLADALPPRFAAELRSRVAISRLMDHLYVIEEYLLALKLADRGDADAAAPPTTLPTSDYPCAS